MQSSEPGGKSESRSENRERGRPCRLFLVRGTGHCWEPREGSEQRRSKTPLTDYQEHSGGWVEGSLRPWVRGDY